MRTRITAVPASLRLVFAAALVALALLAAGCGSIAHHADTTSTGLKFERSRDFFCEPVGRACLSLLNTDEVGLRYDARRAVT